MLGPLLFLIYINDIVCCSDTLNFSLYADDTTHYICGDNLNIMQNVLNHEFSHKYNWLCCNKLKLNINKTCYMITCPLMTSISHNVNIKINDISTTQVKEIKFLGVIIDYKLSWKSQIYDVCNKISKLTGVLNKIRNCINTSCLKQLYISLAKHHLLYCSAIWGGASKTYIDKLFLTQKKIVCIIFHKASYDHTNSVS